MRTNLFLIFSCLILFPKTYFGEEAKTGIYIVSISNLSSESHSSIDLHEFVTLNKNRPTPLLQLFHLKQKKNKKLTAAVLAFPLPFGIVGLHRIYLGSAPYVPVVYIASFGGVLGLLPLIDFCVILLDKKTENYINNKKVFMWID